MISTETSVEAARTPDSAIVAQLRAATKSYGPIQALRNVDFSLRAGELLALLGPNGAGKTTVVKLLLGLARANHGAVEVFGGTPTDSTVRMRVGAMLQVARVPETLRVREHIDLFRSYYPNPLSVPDILAAAGLVEIKDRLFGDLSGGQRQRVLFALAICGDPDLLFLDEPTVGLDVESRRSLWEQIRKLVARGKTVLLTTHYLEEADALADRVVVLNQGSVIAEGTPSQIKAQTAGRRIRCVSQLALDEIRRMPEVASASQDREAVEIRTANAESVLRALLARDPALAEIEVTSAGLEDAFLALTSNHDANTPTHIQL